MFEFKSIASSSSGNCYYIKSGNTSGLIDIGISWQRIQRAIDFKASDLDFVLVTHRHLDHSGHIKSALRAGVNVYAIQDVWDATGAESHRAHIIIPRKQFRLKGLTILAFPVPHDVENVGFLISDGRGSKLVHLTDCWYSPFTFTGLTHILIECNHSYDILDANVANGSLPVAMKKRLIKSHFSLENVKKFLKSNDLSQVREIHLIHLSDGNSHAERFRREVQQTTGKPTYIAAERG